MGSIDAPQRDSGKVLAGLYALYAGLVFIVAVTLALEMSADESREVGGKKGERRA